MPRKPRKNTSAAVTIFASPKPVPILPSATGADKRSITTPQIATLQQAPAEQPADIRPPARPQLLAPPASVKSDRHRPFDFYAYSFWRRGDVTQGVLGNGQYGGSQSALLTTIPLLRFSKEHRISRLAFVGRASVSHDGPRDRELAAGLQWRPVASFPAQLTVERRFRPDRADAFAAFVSGGHDGAVLPLGFTLDGYVQAGIVTGKAAGGFGDGQLHAMKRVTARGNSRLDAGLGLWGGGQSQIMRLDTGPSVRAILPVDSAQLRIDASWRFRFAGNAQPGDGPAVTLSTSF